MRGKNYNMLTNILIKFLIRFIFIHFKIQIIYRLYTEKITYFEKEKYINIDFSINLKQFRRLSYPNYYIYPQVQTNQKHPWLVNILRDYSVQKYSTLTL